MKNADETFTVAGSWKVAELIGIKRLREQLDDRREDLRDQRAN